MNLLEKLRLGFLARSRREKILAVLFLVVIALVWLVFFVDRINQFSPQLAAVRAQANDHAQWFAFEPQIAARYEEALAQLQDRRLKGAEAYARIDQILRSSGLAFRIDPPTSIRREQLTFHPISISITKAGYPQLRDLYRRIMEALPTVNLEEVTIAAPDRTGSQLDAKFKFVAIELNP